MPHNNKLQSLLLVHIPCSFKFPESSITTVELRENLGSITSLPEVISGTLSTGEALAHRRAHTGSTRSEQ